jgi:hypothetical protein
MLNIAPLTIPAWFPKVYPVFFNFRITILRWESPPF